MENRVGFGKRLGTFLIDCVLASVLAFFLGGPIGAVLGAGAGAEAGTAVAATSVEQLSALFNALIAGAFVGVSVVFVLYGVIEAFTGWTLGKLLLGIQVGKQDGTPADPGQLMLRWALKNVGFISGVIASLTGIGLIRQVGSLAAFGIFIGFFFILASARQGFHDMIAKTAVYPRKQLQGD